jgi:hypothetical protein
MTVLLPLLSYLGGGLLGQPLTPGGAKPVPVVLPSPWTSTL